MKSAEVWLEGKRVKVDPRRAIGKGGEADVYDLGNSRALKLYKLPHHPDFAGDVTAQDAARAKLATIGDKLRQFPAGLSERVVAPQAIATGDAKGQTTIGYAMHLVSGVETLLSFGDSTHQNGGSLAPLSEALRDLHATVSGVHGAGIIIGDFNDLNVLVQPPTQPGRGQSAATPATAWLIDADSFGYGAYRCEMFTARFVDPLLCDQGAPDLNLAAPHTPDSDWYAFAAMLMRAFLAVEPYGGLYKPRDPAHKVAHHLRPLRRISVFHPEVRYPKPARPLETLPDELLEQLRQTFACDWRGEFPLALLDNLRWTTCTACSKQHARPLCPFCTSTRAAVVQQTVTIRGRVTATRALHTEGRVLSVAFQDGVLRHLTEEGGKLRREDGTHYPGPLEMGTQVWLHGAATLIGRGEDVFLLRPNAAPQRLNTEACYGQTTLAANGERLVWAQAGSLWRDSSLGVEYAQPIGDILARQTRLWLGPTFGFGFYRASELCVSFVFNAHQGGLNDNVAIKLGGGELVDATCAFSSDLCWFFAALQENGHLIHRVRVLGRDGSIVAQGAALAGESSWLGGSLHGKCAVNDFLLAPTDEGVVRVGVDSGALHVTQTFPDTEPWVRADSRLCPAPSGLTVWGQHDIYTLKLA